MPLSIGIRWFGQNRWLRDFHEFDRNPRFGTQIRETPVAKFHFEILDPTCPFPESHNTVLATAIVTHLTVHC